jgi:hypothetical protein
MLLKVTVTEAPAGTVIVLLSKAMFRAVRFTVTLSGIVVVGNVVCTVVGAAVGVAVIVVVGVARVVVGVAVAFPGPGVPVHPALIPTMQRATARAMLRYMRFIAVDNVLQVLKTPCAWRTLVDLGAVLDLVLIGECSVRENH